MEAQNFLRIMERFGMSYNELEEQSSEFWHLIELERLGGVDGGQ